MKLLHQQVEALQFHLQHIAGIEALQQLERFEHADNDITAMMLEQAARFADEHLSSLAHSGDVSGCTLSQGQVKLPEGSAATWAAWCELGFPSLTLPMEHDGLGLPRVVQSAVQEICDGANLAFGMLAINLRCAAMALIKNADQSLVDRYVPGLVSGELASTIAISEAQAGSDVGRILTNAEAQDDGSWLITGSKLWISYADHDATKEIIHLVLARVPNGEAGTRGLGLFLVPGEKDDTGVQTNGITLLRLEHKMGLHASPTCVIEFNKAKGHIISEPGKGLQALFVMMNAMRLAVAVQGSAVANVASLHAMEYACERPQGGHPLSSPVMISEHADVRRMLLEMTAQSELLRALSLRTASLLDQAEALEGLEDNKAQDCLNLGEFLLPLAKTLNAETAFQVANQGIQVMGGYGYTNDYPIERLARDIRVASIYEGTSGIQALDFLKRRVLSDKGQTMQLFLSRIKADTQDGDTPFSALVEPVCAHLESVLSHFLNTEQHAPESGAYALLQLSGIATQVWNGHVLYRAASEQSDYEQRLKAALSYHAGSILEQSSLWARRAQQALPEYRFQSN